MMGSSSLVERGLAEWDGEKLVVTDKGLHLLSRLRGQQEKILNPFRLALLGRLQKEVNTEIIHPSGQEELSRLIIGVPKLLKKQKRLP